jgi:hypothetical protein
MEANGTDRRQYFMKDKSKDHAATKKLSVILNAKLHGRAKRYALINDMTLTELVILLLEERLQDQSEEK